ncbi:Pc12g14520 [Penicillium rubens Wisconsin 54-1255]|uniref:Pc12g14520 protein n=1 Tax=Penicillium rubens (strain ATCC 28089 / DSM 1075 / NRRL 1951 / Wisconsin 54-1255) TaxID=500485 RepID=B6H123_PENRW|nr:Pc12g14520 [Penicillium rubens Wisconsin 54-1255]
MALAREEMLSLAKGLSLEVSEQDIEDYEALLARMQNALELVAAMDDYQPRPDQTTSPRRNIHFPEPVDNPLGAWAWRFYLSSNSPRSNALEGKTLCLKDNICVASVPCLLGTDTFRDWVPHTDATVVSRILNAGGIITGKAVCENLSRGAVSSTAATGPVHNPYARGYSVGGSSSGTAALVASGATDMGIGCDQGGSIRIPAALAGLYGFKPTAGLVPYTGIASNDASLDYVGPITTTCLDNAVLLEAIAGADGLDDRSAAGIPFPTGVPRYSHLLRESSAAGIKGLRIGILKEGLPPQTDLNIEEKFRNAVNALERLGASVQEVSVPLHSHGRSIYSVVSKMGNHMGMMGQATGRRQVMLTDLFERKGLPYTPDVVSKVISGPKEALLSGEFAWQRYGTVYPKAVNIMRKLKDMYDDILSSVDVMVMPTTLLPANRLPVSDATPLVQMEAAKGMTENTCQFNATGHPALAIPIGYVPATGDKNVQLPASMQIVGRWHDELTIFRLANTWERSINWKEF